MILQWKYLLIVGVRDVERRASDVDVQMHRVHGARAHVEPVGAIEVVHERPWATVLRVAHAYERTHEWKDRAPAL